MREDAKRNPAEHPWKNECPNATTKGERAMERAAEHGALTGEQHELRLVTPDGEARATVVALAGGLRRYTVNGVDLVEPFDERTIAPKGAGITLAPWPNRVRDGRWTLDGELQELDITERETGNAIHGLLRNTAFRRVEAPIPATAPEQAPDERSVTLEAEILPQHGYPFALRVRVTYELHAAGLTVTHEALNLGSTRAPVALGAHPYLRLGAIDTGELTLTLPATTYLEVDAQQIPVAECPVEGTPFDLRAGVRVGETTLDHGFAGLGDEGFSATLAADNGDSVTMRAEPPFAFAQVFTPSEFPTLDRGPARACAVEPMTAPADALNSGRGLAWLALGETLRAVWHLEHHLHGGQPGLHGGHPGQDAKLDGPAPTQRAHASAAGTTAGTTTETAAA